MADDDLHYDPARLRGSVFHLLGCLSEFGKLGMTCIGRSREEAEAVYNATAAGLIDRAAALQATPQGEGSAEQRVEQIAEPDAQGLIQS